MEMPQAPQRQAAGSSLLLSKAQFSSFQVQDTTYKTDLGVSGEGGTNAQKHPELLCTVHVIPSPPQPLWRRVHWSCVRALLAAPSRSLP